MEYQFAFLHRGQLVIIDKKGMPVHAPPLAGLKLICPTKKPRLFYDYPQARWFVRRENSLALDT